MTDTPPRDPGLFDELQRMAARLRDLERDLEHSRLLLSGVPEAIVIAGADGRVTYWNDAATALFGWSTAEMLGRRLEERFPEPTRAGMSDILQSVREGRDFVGECEDFRKDGTRIWIDTRIRGVTDSHGKVVAIVEIARDVTTRKRAEHERQTLEARLLQVKKLESLGVLAGGVAHDFNNLLTSILGNTDLAIAHLPTASPARTHLKHIEYAAQRAADLTRQMLNYSGRGQFVIRPVCLGEVVRARLGFIRSALPPRMALETALAESLPAIDGDPDQLAQLLMNVIANAIEAIGDAPGTIHVRSGRVSMGRADLAGMYLDEHLPEGDYAYVEIADTGTGMPPEIQARMFEPFFTTKFTGRGLGLAAVLGILRGHRGAVRVTSEPGRGTTMRLLFPASGQWNAAAPDPSAAPPTPARATTAPHGAILVIDDEETVRSVARMILERAGFSVVTAASGAEGIARFREAGGRFSAVLLDMRLPIVTSQQVCDELARIRPDVRIILSSGVLEDEAVEGFDRQRIAGYLQKPYRFDELVACVRRVVTGDPEPQA
jgi:two-component system, cell cycle sensor histidine kinase and response regulator CckA